MEETQIPKSIGNEVEKLVESLPKATNLYGIPLYKYQGFWIPQIGIKGMISFQRNFEAQDTDIILATVPKSGTIWLKALTFAIVNRSRYALTDHLHPLLTSNPHQLVRQLEYDLYLVNECPNLEQLSSPKIFGTHTLFSLLPECVKNSSCRIVYLCRNPLDQFVSNWSFFKSLNRETDEGATNIDEALEMFCKGIHFSGPFWDHQMQYWNESLEKPSKVLFMRYEDLKENGADALKKLAEFLGFPFTEEEEKQGVIQDISRLCSFENLKGLEVNKNGDQPFWETPNHAFFRQGEVGDWVKHLTPSMAERIEKLVQEKLAGSGLTFHASSSAQYQLGSS